MGIFRGSKPPEVPLRATARISFPSFMPPQCRSISSPRVIPVETSYTPGRLTSPLTENNRFPFIRSAAPVVSGGRVFAVTLDNQVHALDVADGRSQWSHRGIEEAAILIGAASPAVAGSSVVVPYSSGEIFSLLAENGRVLWNDSLAAVNRIDPIADLAHIRGLPVIDRGLVLAVSHSGRMVAIDLRRGVRAHPRRRFRRHRRGDSVEHRRRRAARQP